MTLYRAAVHVVPRRGLLDPQGKAVADALHTLGFPGVRSARVGRHVVLEVEAADQGAARDAVRQMCERLLANPVTEDYEVASLDEVASLAGRA
jgi:phosphoribosylformylglycinamidine synthase PurS subunit